MKKERENEIKEQGKVMENKEPTAQSKPVNLDLSDIQDDENLVNFMENLGSK